jgi:hypothetical protein
VRAGKSRDHVKSNQQQRSSDGSRDAVAVDSVFSLGYMNRDPLGRRKESAFQPAILA